MTRMDWAECTDGLSTRRVVFSSSTVSSPSDRMAERSPPSTSCSDPTAPVGVFDSGLGGLSVLRAITRQWPGEDVLYAADSGFAPYGERSEPFIEERSAAMVDFLVRQGVKAVVVACNTATVVAVARLRAMFPVPIVALEPAIKPAVHVTQTGVVGVLATQRTLASPSVARLVSLHGVGVDIRLQPCPGWAAQVERGDLDSPATRALVRTHVQPLLDAGADTLVLGCTHYPFLEPLIRELAGPAVTLVESSGAVARELGRRMEGCHHPQAARRQGTVRFYSTGDVEVAARRTAALWGQAVKVLPVGTGAEADGASTPELPPKA